MDVRFAKKVPIRNVGMDEYWLQAKIYENPSILGLGDLTAVHKEKSQSSGGRLDILLKDPEKTMYEVEVMLGETDPSHIIRSIEYWDNEKRKYPQREHFSVLVAESFERRYFNVIQILSMNVPMIAVQVDLLESNNEHILNFTKILDVYAEPEESEDSPAVNESSWSDKSSWTLNTAKELYALVETDKKSINYTQSYISIVINRGNTYSLEKRTEPTSVMVFNVKDAEKVDRIKKLFDNDNVNYNYNRYKNFVLNVDQNIIKSKQSLFKEIVKIRQQETDGSD